LEYGLRPDECDCCCDRVPEMVMPALRIVDGSVPIMPFDYPFFIKIGAAYAEAEFIYAKK
jgi:hypothetical protein